MLAGCGPRMPQTVPVHGKVTWNGKPLTTGTITFHPAQGRTATGQIQPDGAYTLMTFKPGDGALLGSHKVTIEAMASAAAPTTAPPKSRDEEIRRALSGQGARAEQVMAVQRLVPEQYSSQDTTPLSREVKPGQNVIDFNLP